MVSNWPGSDAMSKSYCTGRVFAARSSNTADQSQARNMIRHDYRSSSMLQGHARTYLTRMYHLSHCSLVRFGLPGSYCRAEAEVLIFNGLRPSKIPYLNEDASRVL